ncbi:MAG: hypothetical protein ACH346_00005 [Chthoniobacterales bacterium]
MKKNHAIGLLIIFLAIVAPLSATSTSCSPHPPAKENPGSLPVLASLERISSDLHLTSLQRSVVAGLRSDYRAAALKITQVKYKTSSEVAQAQVDLDNLSTTFNHRVLAILNATQCRRLREIERQMLGGTLLTSPSEQEFLGLSDQQKNQIAVIQKDAQAKAATINFCADQGKLNYHQQVMALHKNRQKHAKKMLEVLTPEQMKIWNAAQGVKIAS